MKEKANAAPSESALTNHVALLTDGGENAGFARLSASLAEIRKLKGVLGYILRSSTSSIIDLNEGDKIHEKAILSSQILDSCRKIEKEFNLGGMESVLVEGEKVKVLCMSVDENEISVFMEKTVSPSGIIKRILI